MKYKVFALNTTFFSLFLVVAAIISSVAISHISEQVGSTSKRLPIYCVETNENKISVTFDAAWSAQDTEQIINILKKHNAKATVFSVGNWVEENPEAVESFYKAGHEIANHSDTHAAFSNLSRQEIRKEILNCNSKIEAITGATPRLVRAPSGDYDNKSIEVAESLGMKMIQWDVDSLDWKLLSVEEMYNRVAIKSKKGSILLFHNGVENTPEALDKILTKLEKDGYEFVTVSELIYWDNYEIDHTGKQIKLN